jgi:DNA-binding NarL/FixJ family response regulator
MPRRRSFAAIIVGKSALLREGLARILHSANFRILASVSSADDVLPSKLQLIQPLFLIVHTGDDFNAAVEQIELFRGRHPGGRIVIMAAHPRPDELVSAFRAGANGYFVDVMTCDVFIKSIELVMMGGTFFPPAFPSFIPDLEGDHLDEAGARDENNQTILVTAEDAIAPQLSPRETSVLRCLVEGDSNKCIARKIDISEATVKVHIKAILRKIRCHNRTQAAIWGMNNGSLIRTANNKSPLITSNENKRITDPAGELFEIKRVNATAPLDGTEHGGLQLELPRNDRLIRKLTTDGRIRPRK